MIVKIRIKLLQRIIINSYYLTLMSEEVDNHVIAQYKIIKKIGSGAYGHVWKVQDRKTKCLKALKKNFDAFSNSTDAQRVYR